MTDRELLEAAARAAGIDAEFHPELGYDTEGMWLKGERGPSNSKYWNPLADDGDALRLAVKLDLFHTYHMDSPVWLLHFDATDPDEDAATRRAIVRAAAAMAA